MFCVHTYNLVQFLLKAVTLLFVAFLIISFLTYTGSLYRDPYIAHKYLSSDFINVMNNVEGLQWSIVLQLQILCQLATSKTKAEKIHISLNLTIAFYNFSNLISSSCWQTFPLSGGKDDNCISNIKIFPFSQQDLVTWLFYDCRRMKNYSILQREKDFSHRT